MQPRKRRRAAELRRPPRGQRRVRGVLRRPIGRLLGGELPEAGGDGEVRRWGVRWILRWRRRRRSRTDHGAWRLATALLDVLPHREFSAQGQFFFYFFSFSKPN